jgi:MoaA/NifB/PqqE/SkfB family radical SAM enzyme
MNCFARSSEVIGVVRVPYNDSYLQENNSTRVLFLRLNRFELYSGPVASFNASFNARVIEPRAIQMDASSHCQLACPSCPTASGETKAGLGAGHLRLEQFQDLLERNPDLQQVELSNYGEMFLNPRLPDLLRSAYQHKVVLHADNGVNLNHASDATLESLVEYRFRSMTCSIDGASAETYSKYRVKGDFDRVMGHIRKINEFKRKHRSGFPLLRWQFIVFGHNEHEIGAARKLAAEMGMSFFTKLSWDPDFSPIQNRALIQVQTRKQELSRDEFYRATGRDYMRAICHQLWRAPVLNWDGRVTGCCRNFWGDFGGNAFVDGLTESLNSEGMQHARQMLMGRASERADLPCTTCELYQVMKRDGNWLTEEEIQPKNQKEGILVSVVPEPVSPDVTDVDILITPGHQVNRTILARPPQALRFKVNSSFSICMSVPAPGDYLVYAFPKRLDPAFRKHYPPFPPVTLPIHVDERPIAQEFQFPISIDGGQ